MKDPAAALGYILLISHIVRITLYKPQTIETVRIIEGKA